MTTAARTGTRTALLLMAATSALACSADPGAGRGVVGGRAAPEATTARPPQAEVAVEYVLAEPQRRPAGTALRLGEASWGVLLDGARAVVGEAGVTFAEESAPDVITQVERIPARFGGGFLFRADAGLYTSATFDGALRPVAAFPLSIASTSFGPDALLVRAPSGERWVVDLATGARKAPSPLGLVDVAALDDGRAIAITEAGGAQLSLDFGKTWRDVRSQLRGAPDMVAARGGDVWLVDRLAQSSRTLRIDAKGDLADVGAMPPADAPPKADPRFPGGDTPLRAALRSGARVGPWTAVVAAGGDILRVDLATGAIVATTPGALPQGMTCEAVTVPDDVVLVCTDRDDAHVVVSGVLRGREPRVERTFLTRGSFFAGDDGALAFAGPCGPTTAALPSASATASSARPAPSAPPSASAAPPPPLPMVCVRNADGQWEPFVLSEEPFAQAPATAATVTKPDAPATSRAGNLPAPSPGAPIATAISTPDAPVPSRRDKLPAPSPGAPLATATSSAKAPDAAPRPRPRPDQVRWIPRLGRPPIALLVDKTLATYDAAWGEARTWQTEGIPGDLLDVTRRHAQPQRAGSDRSVVERRWSATATGAVQAIFDDGRAIEVSPEGVVRVWPFKFQRAAVAGATAFARSNDGRSFQTLDHGRTWAEVASPPSPRAGAFDPRACSALGCDLGTWLRIGWAPTPPAARPEPKRIARAPMVPSPPDLELACLPTGQGEARAAAATANGAEDFALGATTLLKHASDDGSTFEKRTFARSPLNVPLGELGQFSETAPRALQQGFGLSTEPSDRPDRPFGEVVVLGPARAAGVRPELSFVEPLVPSAPIRRISWGLDAITRATKDAGVSLPQLVGSSNLEMAAVVPVTPLAAANAKTASNGDVLASFTPSDVGTLYLLARGGSAPRVDVLFARPGGVIVSAAFVAGGDLVALAVDDQGKGHILRFGAGNAPVAEVAELPAAPSAQFGPANPDAIALGPRGEIAVVRTPSGSEPASLGDPALLILPGPRVTALAPWSTAVSADDPACASDTGAYRATIQTRGAWAHVAGRALPDGAITGMTARVRWSPTRVCVEAIEVPEASGLSLNGTPTETIAVATFAPNAAGRSTIELGSEARTPLSCALAPR